MGQPSVVCVVVSAQPRTRNRPGLVVVLPLQEESGQANKPSGSRFYSGWYLGYCDVSRAGIRVAAGDTPLGRLPRASLDSTKNFPNPPLRTTLYSFPSWTAEHICKS